MSLFAVSFISVTLVTMSSSDESEIPPTMNLRVPVKLPDRRRRRRGHHSSLPLSAANVTCSTSTCFDWSSKYLAVGHDDGRVCLYPTAEALLDDSSARVETTTRATAADAETRTSRHDQIMEPVIITTQPSPVRTVAIGPGSRFLAIGGDDGILTVLCRNSNNTRQHFSVSPPPLRGVTPAMQPLEDEFNRRQDQADDWPRGNGNSLYCGSYKHQQPHQNGDSWVVVHRLSTIDFSIASLKWSPSGRHIAVLGQEKELKVIETVFWSEVEEIKPFATYSDDPTQPLYTVKYDDDDSSGNDDGQVDLSDCDLTSPWPHRRSTTKFHGSKSKKMMRSIDSVSFSQDGKWLAVAEDPTTMFMDDEDDYRDAAGSNVGCPIRILSTYLFFKTSSQQNLR